MIKVGVTGGIGSGKSTVCKIFQVLGVPVYYADLEARKLTDSHSAIVRDVKALFGQDIYNDEGLNRKKVASIVFSDPEKLACLNKIIHPVVAGHFNDWIKKYTNYPMVIKEVAILFESGGDKEMDKVITVTAPEELRIKRVEARDDLSRDEVIKRIQNQMSDDERIKKSDFIIFCNDKDLVIPQVLSLYEKLV